MTYIDIVCVEIKKGTKALYEAPAFVSLSEGDLVMCDDGEIRKVVATLSADPDDLEFFTRITGEKLPLPRLKARVQFTDFYYPEDDNGTDQN